MTETADFVFKEMCNLSQNWEGWYVFSARLIASGSKYSVYQVRKALHELRDFGLVKRDSEGCPAQVSYGEVPELICEAGPPMNGWSVTKKGKETDVYEKAFQEYCKGLEDWANGTLSDYQLEKENELCELLC